MKNKITFTALLNYKHQIVISSLLFFCSLFLFLESYQNNLSFDEKYRLDYLNAMDVIKNGSRPDDIVLTEWTEGNQIVALTGRKVIATSKVYPSESKIIAERYRDLAYFFFAKEESTAEKFLKKYHVSLLFIRKDFGYQSSCEIPKKLCKKNGVEISKLIEKQAKLPITPIYDSDNFIIYKVIK
ncbi:hypothetical protein M1328_02250 [Patescibacteria group bacterium]|nr:hypothetical protein [Patescibacteria group bacterium]